VIFINRFAKKLNIRLLSRKTDSEKLFYGFFASMRKQAQQTPQRGAGNSLEEKLVAQLFEPARIDKAHKNYFHGNNIFISF